VVYYTYYFIYERLMYRLGYYQHGKYLKMLQVFTGLIPNLGFYFITDYFIHDRMLMLALNALFQPLLYFVFMRFSGFGIYREFTEIVRPLLPRTLKPIV
jgi:hypothetical protein